MMKATIMMRTRSVACQSIRLMRRLAMRCKVLPQEIAVFAQSRRRLEEARDSVDRRCSPCGAIVSAQAWAQCADIDFVDEDKIGEDEIDHNLQPVTREVTDWNQYDDAPFEPLQHPLSCQRRSQRRWQRRAAAATSISTKGPCALKSGCLCTGTRQR